MFIHMAIQYPKAEYADELLASMHRVDQAAQGSPGLVQTGAWRDQRSGRLIGLAMRESQEAFGAAAEQIFEAVADDPFDLWCEQPPEVFHLTRA